VPLCVGLIILAIWLLAMGSKGVEISSDLGPSIGGLGIVAAVVLFAIGQPPPPPPPRGGNPPVASPRAASGSKSRKLAALATALILGVGGPVIYWQVIHKPDLPVTDVMKLIGGREMADGSEARLEVPGLPPSRRNLAITFSLENPAGLGDCIQPAKLKLIPILDGSAGKPVNAVPGTESRLSINGVTRTAIIDVSLVEPDPGCRVNLIVSDAVLFN
jgi:hypothetical protein